MIREFLILICCGKSCPYFGTTIANLYHQYCCSKKPSTKLLTAMALSTSCLISNGPQ
ncbi:unnamed protein product [Moneuplotes crassus]|uniref:Uncharacterized protein n=1 Tax=Euplotes crassus TaxID=5936 RepID=A0AAD1U0U3_EUPCR|nr:unnamed protein product [Moneuplotes crassus]